MKKSILMCGTLIVSGLLVSQAGYAAVPSTSQKKIEHENYESLKMALRLPIENRLMALSRKPGSFEGLQKLSFDKGETLQVRWRALTAMARIDFNRSQKSLIKALQSKEWFMRNAALVTLNRGNKEMSLQWSTQLLGDPALVVRTAAAQNLRELKDRRSREALLKAFSAPQNFKGGQSLWVRHHIARALAEMAIPGEEGFLVSLLNEKDERIHPWAVMGLEMLTGRALSDSRKLPENRKLWMAWWQNNKNS